MSKTCLVYFKFIKWLINTFLFSRYEEKTNELVCDKINVAYPIVNGIPNLVPTDGRLIGKEIHASNDNTQ